MDPLGLGKVDPRTLQLWPVERAAKSSHLQRMGSVALQHANSVGCRPAAAHPETGRLPALLNALTAAAVPSDDCSNMGDVRDCLLGSMSILCQHTSHIMHALVLLQ